MWPKFINLMSLPRAWSLERGTLTVMDSLELPPLAEASLSTDGGWSSSGVLSLTAQWRESKSGQGC